jgi:hypothetical protein
MIKLLSQLNYGMLPLPEKVMHKPSGDTTFVVHYDSISSFTLAVKLDLTAQILESGVVPHHCRLETSRLVLSTEEPRKFWLVSEGASRVELSVFQSLVEALPEYEHMSCTATKIAFTGKSQAQVIDCLGLWLSFMASFCSLKLNGLLVAYQSKESTKNKRADPVVRVGWD